MSIIFPTSASSDSSSSVASASRVDESAGQSPPPAFLAERESAQFGISAFQASPSSPGIVETSPSSPAPAPTKASSTQKLARLLQDHALWPLAGVLVLLLLSVFATVRGMAPRVPLAAISQGVSALSGAALCFYALRQTSAAWIWRVRTAWAFVGASGILFALGCLTFLFARRLAPGASGEGETAPVLGDWIWVLQQPALLVGLFLLAWRGRSLGIMRLLTDTLIVVLSLAALTWSITMRNVLASPLSDAARFITIYHPICDAAQLFCVMMLIANLQDRPGLARAAGYFLAGVVTLISADTLAAYSSQISLARSIGDSGLHDFLQGISYPLIGVAALVHARSAMGAPGDRAAMKTGVEDAVEAAPPGATHATETHWEQRLARWHRSAMIWLPYMTTLGVSGVIIGQQIQQFKTETLWSLLPVPLLLVAIVARQMITMWDNLQLAERLRASNADLEGRVDERTRHLATLHGITSTLNTSLDRRTVLRVTLEKTIAAVGADGGGIWLRDARRDVYSENVPGDEWTLVHWQGLGDDAGMISMLRDISIAEAESENGPPRALQLSPATREAIERGLAPPRHRLITIPVRWQGALLGVMGLMRVEGAFTYEDRALVESVALEAGTALQNARLYSEAAHRADRDSVTELFNHRAIQEQLNAMLARAKRSNGQFSLVMMDLNNFKFFNDTYGHPVGDDVLRLVAHSLQEACRTSDILGRYGGDEFIAVLPDTDVAGTIEVCQRIKSTLDARHFEPVPGTRLPIAIGFGWAAYPQDGETILNLLTSADQNLYNHKRGGASYLSQSAKTATESREELTRLKNRAFGGSFGVLDALVTAIDNKDHYTRHHSEEVTFLSLLVAKEIGYTPEKLQAVRISGLLHDVGKIAVPDDILRHPGKLGREEWEIMQQHPVFGALIVKDVPHLEPVLDGIRHHHEKWDGTGYPDRLGGDKIPEMGRLLALADCYSALTTDRPYRKGWKPEDALEEIERCSNTQFDPRLCAIFLRVMRRELELGTDNSEYGNRIADSFGDAALGTAALGADTLGSTPTPAAS